MSTNRYIDKLKAQLAKEIDKRMQFQALFENQVAGNRALLAERDALAEKVEKVRSRCVSVCGPKDAVIPNALDAWGRPVKQFLPYDFSGNPGASATQYCNGWNDSGSYWKAHCVDIQVERDALRDALEHCLDSLGSEYALPSECIKEARAALRGEQP